MSIFDIGQCAAISLRRLLCCSVTGLRNFTSLSRVVVNLPSTVVCVPFTFTSMDVMSQPFLSIYIRKVASVHAANEDSNNVYASGPRSLPPRNCGSSEIMVPLRQDIVHLYFSVPMLP